ncbi:ash family protein [Enterobacter hormaechei]|nr:ash family protein [Enterobacter hormaechei]MDR9967914.1 ash family protein [Enterobacter hormaechei subsp. xiangfangensis]
MVTRAGPPQGGPVSCNTGCSNPVRVTTSKSRPVTLSQGALINRKHMSGIHSTC